MKALATESIKHYLYASFLVAFQRAVAVLCEGQKGKVKGSAIAPAAIAIEI